MKSYVPAVVGVVIGALCVAASSEVRHAVVLRGFAVAVLVGILGHSFPAMARLGRWTIAITLWMLLTVTAGSLALGRWPGWQAMGYLVAALLSLVVFQSDLRRNHRITMKRGVAVILFASFCLPAFAADSNWNSGVLLSYDQQTFMVNHTNKGTGGDVPNTTYRIQIDSGDRIYFVERTLSFAWQKFPRVTENGPVKWKLKGSKEMVIRDDAGKEFTVTITKTRLKTAASGAP